MDLKCSRCISEAKRHNNVLKMTHVGAEGCFINISRIHTNLVIAGLQINLGKISSSMQFIQKILYDKNLILILNCLSIELAVIYAQSPGAIFLFNQYYRGGERTDNGLDHLGFQELFDKLFKGILFMMWKLIRSNIDWFGARYQWNGMITVPLRR